MAEGDLLMSRSERDRTHVVRQVVEHRLSQREASDRLGVGVRQLKRLVRSWKLQGDAGLVSRQRGRASHNRLPEALRAQVTALLREKYPDFGPTLAAEKLLALEGIKISRETIRKMQVAMGLWKPKSRTGQACVSTARAASAIW
jgi:transposase